jgi:hypothetical protein
LKTEKISPTKPLSICWYMAWVPTSTCEGTTARCGWEWYLRAGAGARKAECRRVRARARRRGACRGVVPARGRAGVHRPRRTDGDVEAKARAQAKAKARIEAQAHTRARVRERRGRRGLSHESRVTRAAGDGQDAQTTNRTLTTRPLLCTRRAPRTDAPPPALNPNT